MKEAAAGRFTLLGGPHVEEFLADLVRRASRAVLRFVPRNHLKALVLGGSYGRGEGGIRVHHHEERPASDIDLLLFTVLLRTRERAELEAVLNAELDSLRRRSGVGIDVTVTDARAMERDRVRILWYELRNGHKVLAGDPSFLPGLVRFEAQNIDPKDVADMVINRGALMILNDVIRAQGPLNAQQREAVLTNASRAVIGYGDALLFHKGAYHWSCVERRRRMAARSLHATAEFKTLYETAMLYHFRGDPASGSRLMTLIENGHGRHAMSALHLELERYRWGGRRIVWHGYLRASLRRELGDLASSFRGIARGALTLVRGKIRLDAEAPYSLRVALRASGEAGAVRALFPLLTYGHVDAEEVGAARHILGVKRLRTVDALLAWLRMWSRIFEPNFGYTLKHCGLRLTTAA